jgi:xanthine phosphoribosyltransferase
MNVKTFEEVRQRFLEITFEERFDLIVAVANGGIIPAAMLNQRLNLDMQLLKLHLRDADQKQQRADRSKKMHRFFTKSSHKDNRK